MWCIYPGNVKLTPVFFCSNTSHSHIPGCCVGQSKVKCLAQEHLISSHRGKGESYSFTFRSQISPARVDYSASPKQLLSAAVLACDHVHSYTNTDIPEPLEVPLSSTRWTGIYDPVLIKQSLLVIKPPRWALLEVHFKPLSPSVSPKVMSEE